MEELRDNPETESQRERLVAYLSILFPTIAMSMASLYRVILQLPPLLTYPHVPQHLPSWCFRDHGRELRTLMAI